jgi:hypothetical protein
LEGPWLIFPTGDKTKLTALSVDGSMDTDGVKHYCVVNKWNAGQFSQTIGTLEAGDAVTTSASTSNAADFYTVFNLAFQNYPFVWTNKDDSAAISGQERSLSLPVPNQVHIAGLMPTANMTGSGFRSGIMQTQTVHPHIATILEYWQPEGGINVSLTLSGAVDTTLGPADQLVVAMFHKTPKGDTDELSHMQKSFKFLSDHLKKEGQYVAVTYKDSKFDPADNDGFGNVELGLNPTGTILANQYFGFKKMGLPDGNYSNCCGGGIVSGPG